MGLLVLLPLVLVLAVGSLLGQGRPILFRHRRLGLGGVPFEMVKFRTMRDGAEPDEARVTPWGSWLRRTSLDELPTLWNVVRGEMALVGPRPLPARYLERFTRAELRRLRVRPGVTGLAQVVDRNHTSWRRRLVLDVYYVRNRSLALDVGILARTIGVVVLGRGVNTAQGGAMPELPPLDERDVLSHP